VEALVVILASHEILVHKTKTI